MQTLHNQHHLVGLPEEISETERGLFPKKNKEAKLFFPTLNFHSKNHRTRKA